jgi:hypothetical protein
MTHQAGRVLASLLLSLAMLGSTAQAQAAARIVKANIPFDFVVGNQSFPAGHYSVALSRAGLLELRDSDGRVVANALTQSVEALNQAAQPKLRFEDEGGQHVLTQVWQQGDSTGREIVRSKAGSLVVRKQSGHVQTAEAGNPR